MILNSASEQTKTLTSEQVKLLRTECDDVSARMEAGWLIVTGYKGDKRLVLAHCDSQEQYETKMGILRPYKHWNGYGEGGAGYAFSATAVYEKNGETTETTSLYFCHEEQYFSSISDQIKEASEETFRNEKDGETRKITYKSIYWDQVPNARSIVNLSQSQTFKP
jgi:hypothetical protein